eukprot:3657727-Rhodomonas_salina.4
MTWTGFPGERLPRKEVSWAVYLPPHRAMPGTDAAFLGTGSRGVPHRLNPDERNLYDIGRRKGYLE